MKEKQNLCPKCSSELTFNEKNLEYICKHCGAKYELDEDELILFTKKKILKKAIEQDEEIEKQKEEENQEPEKPEKKKGSGKQIVAIILLLLGLGVCAIFPPVGLVLIVLAIVFLVVGKDEKSRYCDECGKSFKGCDEYEYDIVSQNFTNNGTKVVKVEVLIKCPNCGAIKKFKKTIIALDGRTGKVRNIDYEVRHFVQWVGK